MQRAPHPSARASLLSPGEAPAASHCGQKRPPAGPWQESENSRMEVRQERSRFPRERSHSTMAGVVTPGTHRTPPVTGSMPQHGLCMTLCQHRCCTARWGEAWRHWGEETLRLFITLEPRAENRVTLRLPVGQGCALASTEGLPQHLHDWAASRSLALRQETINTPQLSSLSCWLWSCNL